MICLHPVAMDEAEVKEMKDSLQQKVTATEVKVAIATAKKEIQDQFFRLTRALEGKVDQSFGDALSGAARERKRERGRERERRQKQTIYKTLGVSRAPDKPALLAHVSSSSSK